MECPIIKIKPSSPEQGEFVVINESDFDPAKHARYVEGEVISQHDIAVAITASLAAEDTAARAKRGRK